MATNKEETPIVALQSFIGSVAGEERVFRQGDLVKANDPAIKKWPHLFGGAQRYNEPARVEQATAAPGEQRA